MLLVNENYIKSADCQYLEEIEKRLNAFKILSPNEPLYRIGAAAPIAPIAPEALAAMHRAVDDAQNAPHSLIDKIQKDYRSRCGLTFDRESFFISAGSDSDLGVVMSMMNEYNLIAVAETVSPACQTAVVLSGRAGKWSKKDKWSNLVRLQCNEETDFVPQLPRERVDVIFLSNPNSVTGTVIRRAELRRWVDFAIEKGITIIYNADFQYFIKDEDVPRSIYEIKGARRVAIEMGGFVQNAGIPCGFTVVPPEVQVGSFDDNALSLNKLWRKHRLHFPSEVSYISQRAAEAFFTRKGRQELTETVHYYMINASLIREELLSYAWQVWGGENSPFVWFKIPDGKTSWNFFLQLLHDLGVVGTPGILFGENNDRFMRLSGFCKRSDLTVALKKMRERFLYSAI